MPTLLFIFNVVLILIFNKQTIKFLIPFVLIFSLIFSLVYNFNKEVRFNFINLYQQVSEMIVIVKNKDFKNDNAQYLKQFETFTIHGLLINILEVELKILLLLRKT